MELVYLWVEKYKNIEKQGFNFSPRFKCDYNPDTNELTIDKNDDYIENFFGDNINVTAIVGKNGSGKSSVLKACIERVVSISNNYLENNGSKNDIFYGAKLFNSNGQEIKGNTKDKPFLIYWDYSITDESFFKIIPDEKYSQLSNKDFILLPSKIDGDESQISLTKDIQFLAKNIIETDYNLQIIQKFFNPSHIIISSEESITRFEEDEDNSKELKEYFKDFYSVTNKKIYKLDISKREDIKSYLDNSSSAKITIDFISNDKKLLFLSFGELQLLKILLNLQRIIYKCEKENIIFLLDEIELGLHPEWQKNIVNYLTQLQTNNHKVHFVLTTHSPFMLSDIPKQNIIFLDTDDEGKCKVVDGLNDKEETFGANIHTLLSDSFFMEDGLMGEFAKGKIQEIMDFLNDKKTIEEISTKEEQIKQVIESISEDLLRMKLLDMYYKKFEKNELEREKQQLLEKQKEITELIQSIEKKQKK